MLGFFAGPDTGDNLCIVTGLTPGRSGWENRQDEILKGIKQIATVLKQNVQVYADRMEHFGSLLGAIDAKIGAAGTQTKGEYDLIRQEIKRLQDSRKRHKEKIERFENRQSKQIEELMPQNKALQNLLNQIFEKIQKDYFLSLANDDVKHKTANSNFWVSIEPDKGQGAHYYYGEKPRFRLRAPKG